VAAAAPASDTPSDIMLVPPVDPLAYLLANAASPGLSIKGVDEAWLSREGRGPAGATASPAATSAGTT
jgi:hypothetical protein